MRFDSVRFSISSTRFHFFPFSVFAHNYNEIVMNAAGKMSKGSEAVEAFTQSTSRMHDQQLLLTCVTGACRILQL